jgi:iron complex outermembrane receptor protein
VIRAAHRATVSFLALRPTAQVRFVCPRPVVRCTASTGRHMTPTNERSPVHNVKFTHTPTALISRTVAAVALVAVLLAPAAATAQSTGTIEGVVTVAGSRLPLSEVTVTIAGTKHGSMTDAEGRYRIAGVELGDRVLVAQRLGHKPARKTVTVTAGEPVRGGFEMQEAAVVVAPMVVSATRELQRRADASATIEVLDGLEVRRTRAAHPSQIMNRVPGVHVSDLTGEGHSTAIRQPISTKPLYLYLEDGIPTRSTGFFNHNALYEVNIPQSGGVEVLKGPGTAMYGSDAIGGVINVLTRPIPASPGAELSLEGGAYGYARMLASAGGMKGSQGFRADMNLTRGDGWKDASGFDRQSGTLRYENAGGRFTNKTVLTASNIDQHDVLALDASQFESNRTINKSPIAFRKVDAARLTSAFEIDRGMSSFNFTPYARYDDLSLLPNWQLSYDPQVYETKNTSLGFVTKYRRDFAPMRARVIVGADADLSPGSFHADSIMLTRSGPNNVIWSGYKTGTRQYDYDVTYRALSPYLHTELSPLTRLRLDAGVRYDASSYAYDNKLAVLQTGTHRRPADATVNFTHVSPKVGATLDIAPSLNVYGSYRNGFRAPSQGQLFTQGSAVNTVDLKPVKVDSYEAGIRGQLGNRFLYQASVYDMRLTDDILTFVTAINTRETVNAGSTRHRGIEVGTGIAITSHLRADISYSATDQKYDRWVAKESTDPTKRVDYSDHEIEAAPHELHNVLLTWSPSQFNGGRLAAEWTGVGKYAGNPENTQYYGGYSVVHLHFNYFVTRTTELFTRVQNLTNRTYAEVANYDAFAKWQYTPGAPRSVFAGLRYDWQR